MNHKGIIAEASTTINVPRADVWDALTDPAVIKQFMFGTDAVSEWKVGSAIVWHGMWEGKAYEDKGVILRIDPPRVLQYSHYSPLSGAPDVPENYHTLTYELTEQADKTLVTLSQDNNANEEEREHSQEMWETLLVSLKKVLEAPEN
ncbi:MAG: SRPBCC domain-containing protein [Chloroflexota bacterium]|nr:SRPBCC domain-containing protein [Chloroflexota bacterium]